MENRRRHIVLLVIFLPISLAFVLAAHGQAHQPGLPLPGIRDLGNGEYEATAEVWVDKGGATPGDNEHPCRTYVNENNKARCGNVFMWLNVKSGVVVEGMNYLVGDGDKGIGSCPGKADQDCSVGWCRFEPANVYQDPKGVNNVAVSALFKNWSDDRARWANLTVRYHLAPGTSVPK